MCLHLLSFWYTNFSKFFSLSLLLPFLLELVSFIGVEVISIIAVFGVLVLLIIVFAILTVFLLKRKRKLQNAATEVAVLSAGMTLLFGIVVLANSFVCSHNLGKQQFAKQQW